MPKQYVPGIPSLALETWRGDRVKKAQARTANWPRSPGAKTKAAPEQPKKKARLLKPFRLPPNQVRGSM